MGELIDKNLIDDKRKCQVEGCENLGGYVRIRKRDGSVARRKWCNKHTSSFIKIPVKPRSHGKFKKLNCSKCMICDWVGPCDVHRIIEGSEGGKYVFGNMLSVCPNCHRLHHRGIMIICSDFPVFKIPLE